MKASVLPEPELIFGGGAPHVDPRYGIADYGPVDFGETSAPGDIKVGLVGSAEGIAGIRSWLLRCANGIGARENSRHPTLFRDFPGFDPDTTFRSRLVFDDTTTRAISPRALRRASTLPGARAVVACTDLYLEEIARINESNRSHLVIVARPDELDDRPLAKTEGEDDAGDADNDHTSGHADFHDLLKAKTLSSCPIQIVRSTTWDPARAPAGRDQSIQDEATRAWNLHTALYYKAGGTPWRLPRDPNDLRSLYVGVSFYLIPDSSHVHSSIAQVFDERGVGVVVRGGAASRDKDDRQPHLSRTDASELLRSALESYKREHWHHPARVVLHKTSRFSDDEIAGFDDAANEKGIDLLELIWIVVSGRSEKTRLFRTRSNPVLRGTFVTLDDGRHLLYTRGSVGFYRVYPGMYIPSPISLRPARMSSPVEEIGREVLALTKMNWNQSQLDGKLPITLRASRRVAEILKHVPTGLHTSTRYAHFI